MAYDKFTSEQKLKYLNSGRKGPYETILDNLTSGKSRAEAKAENKKNMEQLDKHVDDLRKDIDAYIVKNGYTYLFK